MKKLNFYLLAALLALLLISFGSSQLLIRRQAEGELRLEVYRDGKLSDTVSLSDNLIEQFNVVNEAGHYNLVEIENGQVWVAEADCFNQVCVHTGRISQPGQVVICAPNKFTLMIKGTPGQVDAVTY